MNTKYLYMRLSMEDKDVATGKINESASISSQRESLRSFLLSHPELGSDFVEIVDDGCTGTNDDRPGLQRILKDIEKRKVDIIIVKDLSRFFRNYIEAGRYLEFVFPTYNVRFISVNDDFDSANLGESVGGPELAIRNLMNQMYSVDTSKKIKSVMDMIKREGKYFAGTAPYGYIKNKEKCTLEVDEETAHVVKDIFQWAADGVPLSKIAQRLNAEHIPTPSAQMASRRGNYHIAGIWKYENVRSILRERTYTGDSVPFRSKVEKVGSSRTICIPQDKRLVIPQTHEAIVSYDLFEKANEMFTRKPALGSSVGHMNEPAPKNTRRRKSEVPVPLVCGCCGLTLKTVGGGFVCKTAQYDPHAEGCAQVRITAARIKKALSSGISSRAICAKRNTEELAREASNLRSKKVQVEKELDSHQREAEASRMEIVRLYEQYIDGTLSKPEFAASKEIISKRSKELKEVILQETRHLENLAQSIEAIVQAEKTEAELASLDIVNGITDDIIKKYVNRVSVYLDGVLDIDWNLEKDSRDDAPNTGEARGELVCLGRKKCVVPT